MTEILAQSLWFVMAFVLVGSSLTLRRLPKGSVLRLILIWVMIFAVGTAAVLAFRTFSG